MRYISLWMVFFVLCGSPAAAQETAVSTTEPIVQTAPDDKDPSRLICKTAKETGSRVKRNKICKTQQDWEDMRRSSGRQVDDYTKQAPPNPLPSS
ncbi:hypothetical protein CHU95_10620 [Niveispirillum lacus]|uniref:Secreted protein n=1 Tax=Niveispirillum lacus TaxID=1981099 RepID=A0A255YZ08_9PROT|nr:hypothetical protein [Niveispirillum lacus]OYQ34476.1 hypothetical protein CHU95_10620 [Niveispirillum lacus]